MYWPSNRDVAVSALSSPISVPPNCYCLRNSREWYSPRRDVPRLKSDPAAKLDYRPPETLATRSSCRMPPGQQRHSIDHRNRADFRVMHIADRRAPATCDPPTAMQSGVERQGRQDADKRNILFIQKRHGRRDGPGSRQNVERIPASLSWLSQAPCRRATENVVCLAGVAALTDCGQPIQINHRIEDAIRSR